MSLTPLTRWEQFMAKIAGRDVSISPLTRREQFYDDIATTTSTLQTKAAATPPFSVSEPTDGQTLVYDATDDVWKNGAGGSGGGALVVTITETPGDSETVYTMDKTWQEIADAIANGPVQVIYSPTEDETDIDFVGELEAFSEENFYGVSLLRGNRIPVGDDGYYTDTPTGYPSCTEGGSN